MSSSGCPGNRRWTALANVNSKSPQPHPRLSRFLYIAPRCIRLRLAGPSDANSDIAGTHSETTDQPLLMRFLLTSSLLLTTPLLAQRIPESEPNDTAATAQAVAMGAQIDANLVAAESDWYSISSAGGQVRFTISGTTDTRLEISDPTGLIVLAGNDDSRGLQSDITINLTAGPYMVRVFGFSATTAGAYSLDIALETPAKTFTAVEVEPNNTLLLAQPIGLDAQVSGTLAPLDEDWYRIVLSAPRSGLFFQVTEGDAPWVSQHRIEFYDAAGVLLPAATLGTNAVDSGTFTFRTATTRVWPAGTYHVVIKNRSAAPTYNPVPIGNYRLEILEMPLNVGSVVGENPEPNSTPATATAIAAGEQGTGSLTISTGVDASDLWGPIAITAPSTITFQTGQGAAPAILDTTINLYQVDPLNPSGPLLLAGTFTSGNLLDPTSHARVVITFFVTGLTYYVEVVSPLATTSGNYVLEYSLVDPAPYVTASYTILASNASCGVLPRPTLTRQFTNEVPTVGQTFSRQITGFTPGGLGILAQGLANTTPLDLASLGTPPGTCFLDVSPDVLSTVIADAAGTVELAFTIPPDVSLRGFILWEQAFELESFSPFTIQGGNYARLLVGERSY